MPEGMTDNDIETLLIILFFLAVGMSALFMGAYLTSRTWKERKHDRDTDSDNVDDVADPERRAYCPTCGRYITWADDSVEYPIYDDTGTQRGSILYNDDGEEIRRFESD